MLKMHALFDFNLGIIDLHTDRPQLLPVVGAYQLY